jgi:predicted HicB family RNase H-like nuclease
MEVIAYKGYHARIEYSAEDEVLVGTVLDINDLLIFEAENACEIKKKFQEMVDDYVAACEQIGKSPEKPFSGTFNVRIPSNLHRQAVIAAAKERQTLNQYVASAIQGKIDDANGNIYLYLANQFKKINGNYKNYGVTKKDERGLVDYVCH